MEIKAVIAFFLFWVCVCFLFNPVGTAEVVAQVITTIRNALR